MCFEASMYKYFFEKIRLFKPQIIVRETMNNTLETGTKIIEK